MSSDSEFHTWQSLLDLAKQSMPLNDSRRIIEHVSGYSAGELVQHNDENVTAIVVARAEEMIARRVDGEPLQYVLGSWSFRELDLFVDNRVLIPRPETEVIAGVAIDVAHKINNPLVVDLGTGSGAIALSVALEVPSSQVIATDASSSALAVARANMAGIGMAAARVRLLEGSWFAALPSELKGSINIVVSNPPYIANDETLPDEVLKYEPNSALFAGALGTEALEEIIDKSSNWLTADGHLILECAPDQAEYVQKLAITAAFDATIISDLAGRQRAVHARRR